MRKMTETQKLAAAENAKYAAAAQFRILGRAAGRMDIVVIREQFSAHLAILDAGHRDGNDSNDLFLAAYSADKKVHAMENAIYDMRMEAELVSGTYAEHCAAFKPAPAVSLVKAPRVNLTKTVNLVKRPRAAVLVDGRTPRQIMADVHARIQAARIPLRTEMTATDYLSRVAIQTAMADCL